MNLIPSHIFSPTPKFALAKDFIYLFIFIISFVCERDVIYNLVFSTVRDKDDRMMKGKVGYGRVGLHLVATQTSLVVLVWITIVLGFPFLEKAQHKRKCPYL